MEKPQLLALTASKPSDPFDAECLKFWKRSAFDLSATIAAYQLIS
jgi:hypothetical protein